MLAGEKRGRARSSPVHNSFRHAANQCGGGKFMLSRNTHTHTRAHRTLFFPLFLLLLSFFFSFFFFFTLFILERERLVTMAVMDACPQAVCPLELRTIVVERGRERVWTIRLREAGGGEGGSWNIERVKWIVATVSSIYRSR